MSRQALYWPLFPSNSLSQPQSHFRAGFVHPPPSFSRPFTSFGSCAFSRAGLFVLFHGSIECSGAEYAHRTVVSPECLRFTCSARPPFLFFCYLAYLVPSRDDPGICLSRGREQASFGPASIDGIEPGKSGEISGGARKSEEGVEESSKWVGFCVAFVFLLFFFLSNGCSFRPG